MGVYMSYPPRFPRTAYGVSILALFAFTGCMATTSVRAQRAVSEMRKFEYKDRKRGYHIHKPAMKERRKLPLVLALHGGGGDAKGWPKYTSRGFETLADQAPFILVYPEGIEGQWNDKRNVKHFYVQKHKVDDVGFLAALIDHLIESEGADPARVYMLGASNGGMMTHYFAATHADKIAAAASVIATIPKNLEGRLSPSRPLPFLMINGSEDPLVKWGGGEVKFGRRVTGEVMSVSKTVSFWVQHNGCDSDPKTTDLPDRSADDGTTVRKDVYGNGKDGSEVILYSVMGGGHMWPALKDHRGKLAKRLTTAVAGKKSLEVDTCGVIWEFFKSHNRPVAAP